MDDIFVSMNIHFLKDFLGHIEGGVSMELQELERKCESGEIKEYEDYESLLDYPLFRAEFGAKTIYYELNAMVESQLHEKATPIFLREKSKGVKYKKKNTASELGFYDLMKIMESEYGDPEKRIGNWCEYIKLRKSVNSFKHNKGFRKRQDYKKDKNTGGINWKWDATLEQAEEYLNLIPITISGIRGLVKCT